jgi:hypothetical protein
MTEYSMGNLFGEFLQRAYASKIINQGIRKECTKKFNLKLILVRFVAWRLE